MKQLPCVTCRIILRQLRLFCKIGIDPAEQEIAQQLLTDIDITPSADSVADSAVPSVDYAAVIIRLREFAAAKPHALMENFARQAATMIITEFAADTVRIYCRKPRPFADIEEAGVEIIEHRRTDGAPTPRPG